MELKISEIKQELSETSIDKLSDVINKYRNDERLGVIKLIQKFEKDLNNYKNELTRLDNMKIYDN